MTTITITFDEPDAAVTALRGDAYAYAIRAFKQSIRHRFRHAELTDDQSEIYNVIKGLVEEHLDID